VDGDRSGEVFEEFGVSVMPTFVVVKNGEEVGRLEGADKDKIVELLENALKPETL